MPPQQLQLKDRFDLRTAGGVWDSEKGTDLLAAGTGQSVALTDT